MNEKKYVQYKNDPNGTKWEVFTTGDTYYVVINGTPLNYSVPKSDYILCAPPERWTDVTGTIDWSCSTISPAPMQCEFILPQHCRAIRVPVTFTDGTEGEAVIIEQRED